MSLKNTLLAAVDYLYGGFAVKWHFRTIGMGTLNYRIAARRLAAEAASTGLFVTSQGYSESFLRGSSPDFWLDHRKVLSAKTPGFGWWVWKPEFIWKSLTSIPEGDGLLYLDAGSFIGRDVKSVMSISSFMQIASSTGICASNSQPFVEKYYSSTQVMDHLNLAQAERDSNQFWAGCLFLVNTESTKNLIQQWRYFCCTNDHGLLLPKTNFAQEVPGFVHHMHDQAILSGLLKNAQIPIIDVGDRDTPGAIRGLRHRFGYPFEEERFSKKAGYRLVHFLSRIRLYLLRRIFRGSRIPGPFPHLIS